jgi:hypothetical protein
MVQHRPSVSLVVLDGDDLIVVRQRRPGSDRELLELPAGTLEPGEDPREAADRLPLPLALGRLDDATSIAALALWQPKCR